MNAPLQTEIDIRNVIVDARRKENKTEAEINEQYHSEMAAMGISAPKAIMTKVRDRRREFSLPKAGAECLSKILNIGAGMLDSIVEDEGGVPTLFEMKGPPTKAPTKKSDNKAGVEIKENEEELHATVTVKLLPPEEFAEKLTNAAPAVIDPIQPEKTISAERQFPKDNDAGSAPTSSQASETVERRNETGRKVSVGIYEVEGGLQLLINMELTRHQFDRLTIAVPEYMMKTEPRGDKIYCRATVPIFSHQAELIMRAIWGTK